MKIDWEFLLGVLVVMLLALLTITVFVAGVARADESSGCVSIKRVEVPPGAVVKVVDGDTFHLFTFDVPNVIKIRVHDAETPERGQDGFDQATAFTRGWLLEGPFQVATCGNQTFDRIVGVVARNGQTLASSLKEAGYWRAQH